MLTIGPIRMKMMEKMILWLDTDNDFFLRRHAESKGHLEGTLTMYVKVFCLFLYIKLLSLYSIYIFFLDRISHDRSLGV